MKKYFRFTLLTLAAALLFTACSNEEEIANNGGTPNIEGGITFTFPAPKAGTTYATIGSAVENNVDLANTTILMFNDATDPVLEAVFSGAAIIPGTPVGANKTLTVVPPTSGLSAGNKKFHFIANTQTATAAAATLALPATIGQTWSQILPLLTDAHTTPGLLPKQDLLMYGVTPTAIDIKTVQNAGKITLKRRVARFDIQHDKIAANGVEIDKVIVNNVVEKGFVLPGNPGLGDVNPAPATNSLTLVAGTDFDATKANDLVAHPNGAESAFYLYPSSLSTTTIQIIDKNAKVYNVAARNIVANTRYVLKVKVSDGKTSFELEVAPWDDTVDALAEVSAPSVSGFALGTATGGELNVDALSYNMTGTSAGTITFSTTSATSAGSTVSIVKEMGDFGGSVPVSVSAPSPTTPTLTYAAGYKQDYTITVPAFTSSANDIVYRIVVSDKAAAANAPKTTISLYSPATGAGTSNFYPGTSLEPIYLSGKIWAPVNVGATTDDATIKNTASTGFGFQRGRINNPFPYGTLNTIQGPLTLEQSNATENQNSIIEGASSDSDWLVGGSSWTSANPCPSGWRMPTDLEIYKLKTDGHIKTYELEKHRVAITSKIDSNVKIYFPMTGFWSPALQSHETYTMIWCNDTRANPNSNILWQIWGSGSAWGPVNLTIPVAAFVRCVKN